MIVILIPSRPGRASETEEAQAVRLRMGRHPHLSLPPCRPGCTHLSWRRAGRSRRDRDGAATAAGRPADRIKSRFGFKSLAPLVTVAFGSRCREASLGARRLGSARL